MPLAVLSDVEALRHIRETRSRWPMTTADQAERLIPLAQPSFKPSFRFDKSEPIFTIGSCFARNIEKQLLIEGYNVALSQFQPPDDPAFLAESETLLNRFTAQSIASELAWALSPEQPFPEAFYFEVPRLGWYDLQLSPILPPSPREVVEARREAIRRYVALAAQARVFIMTLGLAEAWFDTQTGQYLNAQPPSRSRKQSPGRFQFHLLDYGQVMQGLETVHALLARFGRPDVKILLTVSPVALRTTFAGDDVMSAYIYMKSVLRSAAEAFVRGHDNVDYFPSYESVMLSDRAFAWREDQAHVSDEIVRVNVLRMLQAYAAEGTGGTDAAGTVRGYVHVKAAREAVAAGATARADAAYRAAVQAAPDEALILLEYGRFLRTRRRLAEAARMVERSLARGSAVYGGWHVLGQIHLSARRWSQAYEAAAKAREHQPKHPGVVNLSADAARRLGRLDEALVFAQQHRALAPESEPSRLRLEALQRRAAGQRGSGLAGLFKRLVGSF